MKKLLILIFTLFLLVGCQSKKIDTSYVVEAKDCDMSYYDGMSSTGHAFKEAEVSEVTRALNEKGSAVFYIGYKECSNCQRCVKYLNDVAMELGVTVYYINGTDANGSFTIVGDIYDELLNDIAPVADKDEEGNIGIYTPHVFNIIEGKIVSSKISGATETNSDIKKLKEDYRKILEPFRQ